MTAIAVNLGCGANPLPGFVNCDYVHTGRADVVFDVQEPWPFQYNTVREVISVHMLEHLERPKPFFRHAWEAMIPNGSMRLQLPYGGSKSAWWDVEHVRPWFAESFCFLQPGYYHATHSGEHADWAWPYMVAHVYLRVSAKMSLWCRHWWFRRWVVPQLHHLEDAISELIVDLVALKRKEDVDQFMSSHDCCVVPVTLVAYRHHLDGTTNPELAGTLVPVGGGHLAIPGDF